MAPTLTADRSARDPVARAKDGTEEILLLGGYVDDGGRAHREVELAPLSGADEDVLARLPASTPVASVVTAILACCMKRVGTLEPASPDLARDLLVGDRDYLVLKLRELTLGANVWVTLRCPLDGCGKPMDLKLDLRELPIESRPVTSRFFAFEPEVEFRLPTGADQEAVAAQFWSDPELARTTLLRRCLSTRGASVESLAPNLASSIEARMQTLAPSLDVELEAVCPECAGTFTSELDLVPWLLSELRDAWRKLEQEVHLIAWHYHWSEREILSLSCQRRRRYIKLIQQQLDAAWA